MSLESVFKLSLIMNMIDNLTGPMVKVQSSVGGSVNKLQTMEKTFGDMAKSGAVMAGLGAQIATAALSPVKSTFETQRAIGELASLGVKDLGTISKAAESFSDTWAGTTKAQFISAAYDIKSGISSLSDEGVADMTRLSGLTATATKSTTAEMTSLFATGYNIYKGYYSDMSDLNFGEMFAAGIAQSVKQFKTTGSGMAESIQALGASATNAKVPLEEQLSILGMLQATMSGSEAGTKYRAFLTSAAQAGKELGLKFVDANNQLLSMPEILAQLKSKFGDTMDAAEKMQLQKAFGTDEAVSMVDLLYGKLGDLQSNILSVYNSMGSGTGVVTEMANAINNTDPNKYEVLQQKIHNVTEEIGGSLSPTFTEFLGLADRVLTKVSDWIKGNQELVRVIMIIVLALGSFLMAAGSFISVTSTIGLVITKTAGMVSGFWKIIKAIPSAFETLRLYGMFATDALRAGFTSLKAAGSVAISGIKNVAVSIASMAKTAVVAGATALKNLVVGLVGMARQAITTAITAMPGLIASVWSFTAALLANPITWIVIGIVALIAAIILLWNNWDAVVAWIKGVWSSFVSGIQAGIDWIRNLFNGMPGWLKIALAALFPFVSVPMLIMQNWGVIVQFFVNLWTNIKTGFVNGIEAIKNWFLGIPQWFLNAGSKIIETLVQGIKNAAMKPIDAIKSIFQKIRNMLPFSDAKEGPLSQLTLSGHRTMSTLAQGIEQGGNLPAEAVKKGLAQIDVTGGREPIKKVDLKEINNRETETSATTTEKDRGVAIDKLVLNVDLNNIKDLPKLFKLLQEVEDYINSNGIVSPAEAAV